MDAPHQCAALTLALGLALVTIMGGVKVNSHSVSPGGVPFRTIGVMLFVFATVLLLAAIRRRAHHALRPAQRRAAPSQLPNS